MVIAVAHRTSARRLSIMLGGNICIGGQTCFLWNLPSDVFKRTRPGRRGRDWTAGRGHLGAGPGVLQVYTHVDKQAGGRIQTVSLGKLKAPPISGGLVCVCDRLTVNDSAAVCGTFKTSKVSTTTIVLQRQVLQHVQRITNKPVI